MMRDVLKPRFRPSPRYWRFMRNSSQLGREPPHWFNVPITYGQDHSLGSIRILCRAVFPRLVVLRVLLSGDGGLEFGGGKVDIQGWVWDKRERPIESGEITEVQWLGTRADAIGLEKDGVARAAESTNGST